MFFFFFFFFFFFLVVLFFNSIGVAYFSPIDFRHIRYQAYDDIKVQISVINPRASYKVSVRCDSIAELLFAFVLLPRSSLRLVVQAGF